MGVRSVNQHLRVYVSNAAPTAIKPATAGEVSFVTASGAAVYAAAPPAVDYRVIYMDAAGKFFYSPVVEVANIEAETTTAAVSEVQQVDTLTIANAIVGESYLIKLRVPEYGGLLSAQDEAYFYGNYTAKVGDGVGQISAGLGASLKKACDNAPVPFAAITVAGATVVATGIAQGYVRSKWDGRLVKFDLTLSHPESEMGGAVKTTAGNPGTGIGKQVASMEEFYAGYNEGFKNRGGDYPYDTEPVLLADVSKEYVAETIIFRTKKQGSNDMSQRQTIVVFHTPA